MKESRCARMNAKLGKKGDWSSFLKKFLKKSKMKIWFDIFEKDQILMPFSGLEPSKLKFFSKKN